MRYEYNLETGETTEYPDAPPTPQIPVEALITTPEQKIWWDYSTVVEKDNQLVKDMATALWWSPEYLTSLFELANTL